MKWVGMLFNWLGRQIPSWINLRIAEHFQWCAEKHMEWRRRK